MNKRLLRGLTIILPLAFVGGLVLFANLFTIINFTWPQLAILFGIIGLGSILFSTWVFGVIGRQEAEIQKRAHLLESINNASLGLNSELELSKVLQMVVDIARDLTNAKYGALGVLTEDGVEFEQFITSGIPEEHAHEIGPPPTGKGLFKVLLEEGNTLRVSDIGKHSRSLGFPANHPSMKTLIGVPVITKDGVIGDLYVADKIDEIENGSAKSPPEFSDEDVLLIEMFSTQAAIAIENARLYRQVQELVVLAERQRFGMDLHDGIIQSIYAVGLMLEDIKRRVVEEPAHSQERLDEAVQSLNGVIGDLRNYILDLRPQQFQGRDIVQGIEELGRALRANTFISVDLDIDDVRPALFNPEQTVEVLHIFSEALSNIRKHARAKNVRIRGEEIDNFLRFTIEDDGITIKKESIKDSKGNGLKNMRERARAAGGEFTIEPISKRGTRIKLSFPLR